MHKLNSILQFIFSVSNYICYIQNKSCLLLLSEPDNLGFVWSKSLKKNIEKKIEFVEWLLWSLCFDVFVDIKKDRENYEE